MGWFRREEPEVIKIFNEDEIHTISNPYCDNLNCWCHTDLTHHAEVQNTLGHQTQEEEIQAFSFFGIRRKK
jgi:hypothetical protein